MIDIQKKEVYHFGDQKFVKPIFHYTERKPKMINNKRGSNAFASVLFLSLALGTATSTKSIDILGMPGNIVKGIGKGIGSGARFTKNTTVDFVSFVGNLFKTGFCKTFDIAKTGVVGSASLVKNGAGKTLDLAKSGVNLAKSGVVGSATLVKNGAVKTFDLAKAGLGKVSINKKQAQIAAAVIGVAAMFRFFMKFPSADPIRWDKKKFLDSIKDKDLREIFAQAWYFLDDMVIGRASKRPSIRVDESGKKLDVRPGYWPIGLGGYVHMYIPAGARALGFILSLKAFKMAASDGIGSWKDFVGYNPTAAEAILSAE